MLLSITFVLLSILPDIQTETWLLYSPTPTIPTTMSMRSLKILISSRAQGTPEQTVNPRVFNQSDSSGTRYKNHHQLSNSDVVTGHYHSSPSEEGPRFGQL